MKPKAHVWKCTKCKLTYIEDTSQIVDSGNGITERTLRDLTDFIDQHDKKTGHKGFNLWEHHEQN